MISQSEGNYNGLPFTSPVFALLFGSRLLNKCGVVFLSEACTAGKPENVVPITNLYVLVAALLSIIIDHEPLTVYTATGLVLAVTGSVLFLPSAKRSSQIMPSLTQSCSCFLRTVPSPILLSVKQPTCNRGVKVSPNVPEVAMLAPPIEKTPEKKVQQTADGCVQNAELCGQQCTTAVCAQHSQEAAAMNVVVVVAVERPIVTAWEVEHDEGVIQSRSYGQPL